MIAARCTPRNPHAAPFAANAAFAPTAAHLQGTDREQYLGMGLNAVVGALSFLANDCALIHGAVSMAAVRCLGCAAAIPRVQNGRGG